MVLFEKNVDEIMGVFIKTIEQLNNRAATCFENYNKAMDEAQIAKAKALKAEAEAVRAIALAKKLEALVA